MTSFRNKSGELEKADESNQKKLGGGEKTGELLKKKNVDHKANKKRASDREYYW